MKKHLALVLALVMVLTSFSFVSAAPDFADVAGTEFENAVNRLELLEILKGYPDGTFKPEDSITRAEFAAVAVRAKGLSGVAEAAAGLPSGFSDVPAWHWAAGYVGTAGSTGIVNGIGNGLFAPAAPVKYEEAVTMLVRALGYEPEAQTKGGYPYGYLVVAEEIGLLDGARSTTGSFATRGLVALLTDNAMEIPMMVSIGFGDNVRWVVSGSKEHGGDEVYLLHSLGVDEFEGIVMENFHVNSRLDAEEIRMYDLNDEKNVTLEVTGSVDVNAILGLEVTAWAKDDVVFAVTVDTDADLVAYDTVTAVTEDDVKLVVVDDTFDWAVRDENYGDAKVYVNNADKDVEDAVGFGRIVMNDDDEIVFAYLFDFDDYGVTTEVTSTDMEYVSIELAEIDSLELDDAEEIYVFTKEFAAASLEDLVEDMSVFYWIDSDDNYFIVAFDDMVNGELEEVRVRDWRITVEGTNYSAAKEGSNFVAIYSDDEMDSFNVWDNAIEELVDEDVVVYLDVNGKAMLLTTDASVTTTVYGVATWYSAGRTDKITVFNADGEEVEYSFDKSTHGFPSESKFRAPVTPSDVVSVGLELNKDAEVLNFTTDGSIFAEKANLTSKRADDERVTIDSGFGSHFITEDTVIIRALNGSDELKPSIIEYDDIVDLAITTSTSIQFIVEEEGSRDLALLVFTEPDFQVTDDTMYGIVTVDEYRRGSDYYVEIDVAGEGKAVYTLSRSNDLRKGDLVEFALNNSGDAVIDTTIERANYNEFTDAETNVNPRLRTYFTVDGQEYRVTSDTLFYKVDEDGALDGTTSYARIEQNDNVVVLGEVVTGESVEDAMVVVDLTALFEDTDAGDPGVVFTTTGASITVSNVDFDTATTGAKNTYTVRATGDATTTAVYSSTDTLTSGTDDLDFTVEITKSGFYDVELIRVADERVIATDRVYLEQ